MLQGHFEFVSQIFEPALQDRLLCRRRSDNSNASYPPGQVFTTVGIYKVGKF